MMPKRKIESFSRVIRCQYCRHSGKPGVQTKRYGENGVLRCNNAKSPCNRRLVRMDDYCSYAEEREE